MLEIIKALVQSVLPGQHRSSVEIEVPNNENYGDYSTNIALVLAKETKKDPREIANKLKDELSRADNKRLMASISVLGAGFINFKLSDRTLTDNVRDIMRTDRDYGRSKHGRDQRVLLEFVSANPTGPLHIGHGRWAAIGDSLANILRTIGHRVDSEFYVNDAGEQVERLTDSIISRFEDKPVPANGYAGSYVADLAKTIGSSDRKKVRASAIRSVIEQQKHTLEAMSVRFNKWYYESDLHRSKKIPQTIKDIKKKGLTFHEGNALWFKSSEFGDDKNRVLVKEDGSFTYFAADIAYHADKFRRGYNRLINVWGTDHHGYVPRLKAALEALGYPAEKLEIIIGQLVALYRGSELVRMSKRTGEMVTLKEVLDEIGEPATRYFLTRNSPNTHLDFDLELAKSKSMENPVYYVGYAHARICSILKEAKKAGLRPDAKARLSLLTTDVERKLMLKLMRYPDELVIAGRNLQPHRLTAYGEELAGIYHNYYHQHRVITGDRDLSISRLVLAKSTSIVIRNMLKLLGIEAPKEM